MSNTEFSYSKFIADSMTKRDLATTVDVQFRPRELCALCVHEAATPSSYIALVQHTVEGIWEVQSQGVLYRFNLRRGSTSDLNGLAGSGGRFADAVWQLNDPNAVWLLNGSMARVFAETNYFGLQICYSHIWTATEMWTNNRRVTW